MADTKISALSASTTPLVGTEVLPIVQSGTTKKVSVANLTAGRAVDASSLVLTNANPRADWVGTSYTYLWQVVDSDNRFRIYDNTNFAERVTVDSTGKVGIANAAPRGQLDVTGTTAVTWTSGANNVKGLLTVGTQGTSGGSFVVNTASLNSDFGSAFAVDGTYSNPGGVGTSVVRMQALGVASPGGYDSALAFHTALGTTATEKWRIDSGGNFIQKVSAKGVNFTANTPAAGMTSQLLNWYEEGTWTPVISDGTNNATMSANSAGLYTRIGRQVTLIGQVETSSLGSVTGNIRIAGLPFAAAAGTAFYSSGAVGYAELLNITAGQSIGLGVFSGNNYITMFLWDSAAGVTPLQASEWSADGTAAIQITYFV